MQGEQPSIYEHGKLTFYVYEKKVIVTTKYQAFYLQPRHHQRSRHLQHIMTLISLNQIHGLNDLAYWTNPDINWVPTDIKNHLAKAQALV